MYFWGSRQFQHRSAGEGNATGQILHLINMPPPSIVLSAAKFNLIKIKT